MNPALLNRGLHILLWASFGYFLGLAVGIAIEKINHKEFSDRIGSAVAGGIGGGATILLIQSVWVSAVFHGRRRIEQDFFHTSLVFFASHILAAATIMSTATILVYYCGKRLFQAIVSR